MHYVLLALVLAAPVLHGDGRQDADGGREGNLKIAFTSYREGNFDIYVMNSDGTGQTRLTNNRAIEEDPAFSPDGSKIAFSSGRNGGWDIYVMNSDGTGQTRLTNDDTWDVEPSFSPDGSKIVFLSDRKADDEAEYFEIYVMDIDGANQKPITYNPKRFLNSNPAFNSDGSKITFNSERYGPDDIFIVSVNGIREEKRLTNSETSDRYPTFSPDGSKIAYSAISEKTSEIHIINADGSGQTNLTKVAAGWEPTFNPDGTKIAFVSIRDGNYEIYIMNADGTGQTRLTENEGFDYSPSFPLRQKKK